MRGRATTMRMAWRHAAECGNVPRPPRAWLHINGRYAKGDFPIPAALAEAAGGSPFDEVTRVLNLASGVTCAIAEDAMECAPAFVFSSARGARAFRGWILAHLAEIRSAAESRSARVKLSSIESHVDDNIVLIRLEFGAAGALSSELLAGAVHTACEYIEWANPTVLRCLLMSAGGRRVVAQAKVAGALLRERLGIVPAAWRERAVIDTLGNSSTVMYSDVTPHDELYLSIMIPELMVSAAGDHLASLGCAGPGNANKLAEIVAAAALATWLSRDCEVLARARAG